MSIPLPKRPPFKPSHSPRPTPPRPPRFFRAITQLRVLDLTAPPHPKTPSPSPPKPLRARNALTSALTARA